MYDLVAFGEAMIRLSPPNFKRLEQKTTLDLNIGGAELNVAVGISRLGMKSAWVSVLPANPLGRMIANKARELGVDILITTEGDTRAILGIEAGNDEALAEVLLDRYPMEVVAVSYRKGDTV